MKLREATVRVIPSLIRPLVPHIARNSGTGAARRRVAKSQSFRSSRPSTQHCGSRISLFVRMSSAHNEPETKQEIAKLLTNDMAYPMVLSAGESPASTRRSPNAIRVRWCVLYDAVLRAHQRTRK